MFEKQKLEKQLENKNLKKKLRKGKNGLISLPTVPLIA